MPNGIRPACSRMRLRRIRLAGGAAIGCADTPPRARYLCAIREGIHKRSCLFDKYDFFPKSTSPTDGNAIFECYIGLL